MCEENLAKDIISGDVIVNDDDTISKTEVNSIDSGSDNLLNNQELPSNAKKMITNLLTNAISDYGIYLDKGDSIDDRTFVEDKIKELQMLLAKNAVK